MLETVRRALGVKEIRQKLLFTFLMLIVIRLGSNLPTPGVDEEFAQNFFAQQTAGDLLGLIDGYTGGSFTTMSLFALGIGPYITSSIIIQLLTIVIPKLEELQKEGGEEGRKKITMITRYLTAVMALVQSIAMAIGFGRQGILTEYNFVNCAIMVITFTAGSAFLMWVGERITERGVGNGISIVLLINIVSTMPSDFKVLFDRFMSGQGLAQAGLAALIIALIVITMVVFVVLLQGGQRRIAVQYSQKMQGRKTYGGQSSHIPLKVNTAGVIPVIFASSLMQTPVLIASFFGAGEDGGIGSEILNGLSSNNWCNPEQLQYTWGLLVYIALTILFAYFYTSITFNPIEVANNMKKNGGFVPGIRPGKPTSDYLAKILSYIVFIGAAGLVIVQVIPFLFNGIFGAQVSFFGTSLIIIVGVIIETIKQIESQLLVRNYKGFLNK